MNHTTSKRTDFCHLTIDEMEKAIEFARENSQLGPFLVEWHECEILTDKRKKQAVIDKDDMPTGLYVWARNGTGQKLD